MKDQEYKIIYVPVEDLEYDKENPRLPHSIVDSDKEGDVIDWMLKDASIIELMGSIGEKGFFPGEPLLVTNSPNKGKYIVVEGNRRLTAVKLLNKPELATRRTIAIKTIAEEATKKSPKSLPIMVFSKKKEILDYLGFKHITGVKQWSALAKAKYLKELQNAVEFKNIPVNEQYKRLAKAIGSRSDYVRDLLIGLNVFDTIYKNKYFGIKDLNEETIDFGVYYNALKYSNIPKFLGIDKNNMSATSKVNEEKLKQLTKIISEKDSEGKTILGESRSLGDLNLIILEDRALQMIYKGKTIKQATIYLEGPKEVFKNTLEQVTNTLEDAISIFNEISKSAQSDVTLIEDIKAKLMELEKLVNSKLTTRTKRKTI